jgi:UDP-2,3-diacylglucosamine pyrophosphatase LpxH
MSAWNRPIVETISSDQKIWFISDLHLGDGTRSDVFFGKDRHLIALIEQINREGGTLVVNGDAMDFHQAITFTRILKAHEQLLGAMSGLARQGKLIYVVGNHDYDIGLYRNLLHFRVCHDLHIGDRLLVQHGYQYDAFIGDHLEGLHLATKVHHAIERYFDTWMRIPLGEFYTLGNRVSFWVIHKMALAGHLVTSVLAALGAPKSRELVESFLTHWTHSNLGDPMEIFWPAVRRLREEPWQAIVCGHSHLPGLVPIEGKVYANTGSWTFGAAQYLFWDGQRLVCRDWISGRVYEDELYRPIVEGVIAEKDYWCWWRENYMGWLRFREGEEKQGRMRGWEAAISDSQARGQLDLHPRPARPPKIRRVTRIERTPAPVPRSEDPASTQERAQGPQEVQ